MSEVTPRQRVGNALGQSERPKEEGAPEGQRNAVPLLLLAALVIYWTNFLSKCELVWVEGRQSRLA